MDLSISMGSEYSILHEPKEPIEDVIIELFEENPSAFSATIQNEKGDTVTVSTVDSRRAIRKTISALL